MFFQYDKGKRKNQGDHMINRRLGQSDLEVSPIIFGAWAIGGWYWGGSNDQQAIEAIHASMDAGVSSFDTAPVYGFGHSESVLGKALKGKRDQAIIMTKVGLRWNSTDGAHFFDTPPEDGNKSIYRNLRPHSIKKEVEDSLTRLQTDYIDLLQCHWPDPSTEVEETMKGLASLVKEGKVRAIGVSNFDTTLLERAKNGLDGLPLASNQPRYSLLDRKIEEEILPWLIQHNVASIVYSPLEQGLLTGTVTPERSFPKNDGRYENPLFRPKNRRTILKVLEKVLPIAQHHNITLAQLSSAWCFHQPGVTAAIVGARNARQAKENAQACHVELSTDELQQISSIFSSIVLER